MEMIRQELGTRVPLLDIPGWCLPILAELIHVATRLGVDLPVNREAVLMARQYLYYDNRKAVDELGLQVRPFTESIRDTFDWYAKHGYLQKRGIP